MPRRPDRVEVVGRLGRFDRFEALEIANDILGVSEGVFRIGDDGSYPALEEMVAPGEPFKVYLNARLRLTGRAEINDVAITTDGGAVLDLTVRSKLSDAHYASADPNVAVRNTSIRDFILALYEPLGFTAADFVFGEFADRDLMTGKAGPVAPPVDLESIPEQQAKVKADETIFQAADRHLRRHRAIHWDAPDGRILVGRPDDTQAPFYRAIAKRGAGKANNLLSVRRMKDWSEIAWTVRVYGQSLGRDIAKKRFSAEAIDSDVDAVLTRTGHFRRLVVLKDEAASKERGPGKKAAQLRAERELSARRRRKDAWELTVDGWSYWDGEKQIPWATNTTIDIDVDAVGGPKGRYLIVRTALRLDTSGGATTHLTVVAPDVWLL